MNNLSGNVEHLERDFIEEKLKLIETVQPEEEDLTEISKHREPYFAEDGNQLSFNSRRLE